MHCECCSARQGDVLVAVLVQGLYLGFLQLLAPWAAAGFCISPPYGLAAGSAPPFLSTAFGGKGTEPGSPTSQVRALTTGLPVTTWAQPPAAGLRFQRDPVIGDTALVSASYQVVLWR
ncbi:unnamed protein product [Lepidochelys kempii]